MENSIIEITNELEFSTENIQNLIYTIRDKQVMLDSDVAMLYHYETKDINNSNDIDDIFHKNLHNLVAFILNL